MSDEHHHHHHHGIDHEDPDLDLTDAIKHLSFLFTQKDVGLVGATEIILQHLLDAFPKHNVIVVHPKHLKSLEDFRHFRLELPHGSNPPVPFDIYVFKKGYFTLCGEDGEANWNFGGNYKRDGHQLEFFERN
jgi:hypothetical protein